MPIKIITRPAPASSQHPRVLIAGLSYKPAELAADGRQAAVHVREALYSGQLPRASWAAAERFLRLQELQAHAAVGGSSSGARKCRGGKAYYAWVTACREAKRAGLPKPPRPPESWAS